jgi:hypothetical protein
MKNDYLAMYLFLLNQRYSLMYLLSELTKTTDSKKLDEIEDMLNNFKVCFSFKIVSNEMVYQNLYNKMYNVLGIDKLIDDVQDASERLEIKARKEDEARENLTNILLIGVGFLAVGSALIDFADYIDRLSWFSFDISTAISFGISVLAIVICLIICIKRKGEKK